MQNKIKYCCLLSGITLVSPSRPQNPNGRYGTVCLDYLWFEVISWQHRILRVVSQTWFLTCTIDGNSSMKDVCRAWKWSLPMQNYFLFQFIIHLPHCVLSNCADISSRLVSGLTRPYYLCRATPYGCHPGAKLLQTYIENSPKMFFQNLFAFVCAVVEYKYKMKLMRSGGVRGVQRQRRALLP